MIFAESSDSRRHFIDRRFVDQWMQGDAKRFRFAGRDRYHSSLFLFERANIGVVGGRFQADDVAVRFGGGVFPQHKPRQTTDVIRDGQPAGPVRRSQHGGGLVGVVGSQLGEVHPLGIARLGSTELIPLFDFAGRQ